MSSVALEVVGKVYEIRIFMALGITRGKCDQTRQVQMSGHGSPVSQLHEKRRSMDYVVPLPQPVVQALATEDQGLSAPNLIGRGKANFMGFCSPTAMCGVARSRGSSND